MHGTIGDDENAHKSEAARMADTRVRRWVPLDGHVAPELLGTSTAEPQGDLRGLLIMAFWVMVGQVVVAEKDRRQRLEGSSANYTQDEEGGQRYRD